MDSQFKSSQRDFITFKFGIPKNIQIFSQGFQTGFWESRTQYCESGKTVVFFSSKYGSLLMCCLLSFRVSLIIRGQGDMEISIKKYIQKIFFIHTFL